MDTLTANQDTTPAGRPVGHEGTRVEIEERSALQGNGFLALGLIALLAAVGAGAVVALGLIGLAERTALAGGRLTHRVTPDHEFVLTAWIPWPT